MRVSVNVTGYSWPGGPTRLASDLVGLAQAAESGGLDTLWLNDHLLQADPGAGPTEHDMLEVYTALGFVAAATERIRLGAMVTAVFDIPDGGVTLRHKLDVLRRHCEDVGRDVTSIATTVSTRLEPDESADDFARRCARLHQWGLGHAVVITPGPWTSERVATLTRAAALVAD